MAELEGYRQVAPVSKADEAMLPVFVMLRRMLLMAWIASHSDTETARRLSWRGRGPSVEGAAGG